MSEFPISVGIFYGSTTGNTRRIAERLAALVEEAGWAVVELLDVGEFYLEEMADFDLLIIGQPTWNVGQMQRDWQAVFDEFDSLDLAGRPVALFSLGDQAGYPDTFVDSLAFFADKLDERGAVLLGAWPSTGYDFRSSWALRADGNFPGLVLDEENQSEMTDERLIEWLAQLRSEYMQMTAQQASQPTKRSIEVSQQQP